MAREDYSALSEPDLQRLHDQAVAEVAAAQSRAAEIGRVLDGLRTRDRLRARLGNLSPAERDVLSRDAVALCQPAELSGTARPPQA